MTQKIAIKKWFLRKQGFSTEGIKQMMNADLHISKETEKAVFIKEYGMWIPKSCMAEEWDTKKDAYDYHDYLVERAKEANPGFAYIHQMQTKEIIELLNRNNIEYLKKEEYIG